MDEIVHEEAVQEEAMIRHALARAERILNGSSGHTYMIGAYELVMLCAGARYWLRTLETK